MNQNVEWGTSTELAEQAADHFNLYAKDGSTIPEWVFEISGELQPTT